MSDLSHLFSALPWWAWIAIVAMVCGSTTDFLKRRYRHLERMEMIRQGINPDGGKPGQIPEC